MTAVSASGKQHVELHRKLLLRRHLLRWAADGAAYVPFIGDGDIAAELYADRPILGADLDPDRAATARLRLAGGRHPAVIRVADCNGWPFADATVPIAVADFDAYLDPYSGFRAFWPAHTRAERLVVFFTDGHRQSMMRRGKFMRPDGTEVELTTEAARPIFHAYLSRLVWPWLEAFIAPWRILDRFRYTRGWMVYHGAVLAP